MYGMERWLPMILYDIPGYSTVDTQYDTVCSMIPGSSALPVVPGTVDRIFGLLASSQGGAPA